MDSAGLMCLGGLVTVVTGVRCEAKSSNGGSKMVLLLSGDEIIVLSGDVGFFKLSKSKIVVFDDVC